MKTRLLSLLAFITIISITSCTQADYLADANDPANESVNPMNLLTADDFNAWDGTAPLSAKVNGVGYQALSSGTTYDFVAGFNIIKAYTNSKDYFYLKLSNVYAGNVYNMGSLEQDRTCYFKDSTNGVTYYGNLGNVGQVYIIRNDSANITGKFHFQALSAMNGILVNVSSGYFNVNKY